MNIQMIPVGMSQPLQAPLPVPHTHAGYPAHLHSNINQPMYHSLPHHELNTAQYRISGTEPMSQANETLATPTQMHQLRPREVSYMYHQLRSRPIELSP
ncbi:hypothetical protein OBBRIDRAFT_795783 [Obba rivulosa]|uniref:Uncharacterized protein n=1 Tax=Obba rivulosa TaxID=1052685 RepID=A0A8E2AND0_9APHY|nr:hypothetical protein OBBRIDRAFT_795783 [Obba rivulosa]